MDMHNVRWPGWQAVRPLGGGAAGEVFEIQHYGPAGIESGALKVLQLPRDPASIQQLLDQGEELEAVKQRFHARADQVMGAYGLMAALKGHPNVLACEEPDIQPMADGIGWEVTVKTELLTPVRTVAPDQVARLGADVATALALCHERGLVHEGVKLSNVFASEQGYKLGDFGAAKATGMPCGGDVRCMSPEMYWGMGYEARSDVYALGVLLYTLLNGGCLPLTAPGADAQAINDACVHRLTGEALPLPATGDERLQQIVMQACSYEPAKRQASAMELRTQLLALLGEDAAAPLWPVQAPVQTAPTWQPQPTYQPQSTYRPQPEPEREAQPVKKKNNSTLFLILAVAAAVLVLGVVGFFTVHIWSEVSCNQVAQCVICGKTADKAQAHKWVAATCTESETCSLCGETKGEPLGHQWSEATKDAAAVCAVCGESDGKVLQPTMWVIKLISSGWQGSHKQTQEGSTVTLAFPEDASFATSQVTVSAADGKAVEEGLTAQWNEGVLSLTPAEGLEPGVYNVQMRTDDAGAMITLCWGYEGEIYLSSNEQFWSGNTWCSDAHGTYLAIVGQEVKMVGGASAATVFDSARDMFGMEEDTSGNMRPQVGPTVTLDCMAYVRNGQDQLTVFTYEGRYLACDEQGQVYMSKELDENCFWIAGR